MAIHLLGIRHHGPGSAKNVLGFLQSVKPDIILVEGPPEAAPLLEWLLHEEMKPPVALLCYQPDNLQRSSFYPFAEFSPEWQALCYAQINKVPVRFMDLPLVHAFALKEETGNNEQPEQAETTEAETPITEEINIPPAKDPIAYLAQAAGFADGEKWWEHQFEYRQNNEAVFEAVAEAIQALREALPEHTSKNDLLREAWMRKTIR
ncbi:MAG: hypothetical protein JNM68_03935, partial [Dinghuibacter sp.]|nr:hypothetical protein [Dinghuibacter sp.]